MQLLPWQYQPRRPTCLPPWPAVHDMAHPDKVLPLVRKVLPASQEYANAQLMSLKMPVVQPTCVVVVWICTLYACDVWLPPSIFT